MPIYEYRCQACDSVVEIIHGMTDDQPRVCDVCGEPLERLISRSSFALKGDGWYADLYSSSKKKDSPAAASPTPAASSSGESKPAAESAGKATPAKASPVSPKSSE